MQELKQPSKKPLIFYYVVIVLVIMLLNATLFPMMWETPVQEVDYTTFMSMTYDDNIGLVQIDTDEIIFTDKAQENFYKTVPIPSDMDLVNRVYEHGGQLSSIDTGGQTNSLLYILLSWILPFLPFLVIGYFLNKRMKNAMGGGDGMMFGMGKSNAKIYVNSSEGIHFSDVAGEDEAKENLAEIVEYLHNPGKYREIGASMPKGVLLVGPPGTGKTMLAEAISQALGKKLIIWNIKSTTKAQDGLYVYDVVQRLYDSQFGGEGVDDIAKYVRLGKLGEAFTAEEQVILLIDEIDKADLEFPNDLLWELDRMEFYVPETKETIKAKQRPVVIITSNAEKELPDAFLRRCVFHYIEFPDKELMAEIVRVHFPDLDDKLLTQALEAFYRIRQMPQIKKKPSTSEIIDWLRALVHEGVDPKRVVKEVPYLGVLLKKNEDMDALRRAWR